MQSLQRKLCYFCCCFVQLRSTRLFFLRRHLRQMEREREMRKLPMHKQIYYKCMIYYVGNNNNEYCFKIDSVKHLMAFNGIWLTYCRVVQFVNHALNERILPVRVFRFVVALTQTRVMRMVKYNMRTIVGFV